MKIQPIDLDAPPLEPVIHPAKPLLKSRFRRLFDRQFSSALRIKPSETPVSSKEGSDVFVFEPSSICLSKMVQNFIEDSNEKPPKCGRRRCNCFNGSCTESSDDEQDSNNSMDACDILKILVPALCVSERNLLADTTRVIERNKITKRKDSSCRKMVTDGLIALGYNSSICKSKWEKSPNFPAGEYEYVDVIIEGQRFIIDIDFRSVFEIARPTKAYKLVIQTLPNIFVGKSDRLENIIDIVSEAAKHSLKKRGMPCPPWRRVGYVKSKWLAPYTRNKLEAKDSETGEVDVSSCDNDGEKCSDLEKNSDAIPVVQPWVPPPVVKPKNLPRGGKIVTGLSSIMEDKKPY